MIEFLAPLFFFFVYAPVLFLRHGPEILDWLFGWWGWLAGLIVGLTFFLAAIFLLIHTYREACDAVRGDETSCEVQSLLSPVMIGWYLLILAVHLPLIVRTLRAKPQNRIA